MILIIITYFLFFLPLVLTFPSVKCKTLFIKIIKIMRFVSCPRIPVQKSMQIHSFGS